MKNQPEIETNTIDPLSIKELQLLLVLGSLLKVNNDEQYNK